MRNSFLPNFQREPLGGSMSGGSMADYKRWVGTPSTTSDTGSSSSYDGSSSIWETLAANAGSTLSGLSQLIGTLKGQNQAPTINNYTDPANGVGGMSTIMIVGVAILLILVLVMAMRPKTAKS